ncbi:MAG: hypothetical protein P8Y92_12095 [Halioglobus sp.]
MQSLRPALLAIALTSSFAIADDCVKPDAPSIPDGASSTMEQMLAGQKAVKAFQAANLEYMGCLEPLVSAAQANVLEEEGSEEAVAAYKKLEETYNAAVSMEEEIAGAFNAQIKAYKAAHPQ